MGAVQRISENRSATWLGPARVVDASAPAPIVDVPGVGPVPAELATAIPYACVDGDVLLVIGQEERYWVIGVVSGAGKTSLVVEGDLELRSLHGSVRIAADRDVEIAAPAVEVRAGRLDMIAEAVSQAFESLSQRVATLLHVHAGEHHVVVDEASTTHAKRAALLTDETVTINGKEIHLG